MYLIDTNIIIYFLSDNQTVARFIHDYSKF